MSQQKRAYGTAVSRRGQTMTEYAMILRVVAAVCIALIQNGGNIVPALVSHADPFL
jgi:hypothetical protein